MKKWIGVSIFATLALAALAVNAQDTTASVVTPEVAVVAEAAPAAPVPAPSVSEKTKEMSWKMPAFTMNGERVGGVKPWQLDFQVPASPMMEQLVSMHEYLLYLIAAISVFVLGLLFYVLFRFNEKRNPVPSKTTHNTLIEVIWTVVPIMILVAIAIPSLRLHYYMDKTDQPEMTLKVVGYQWYWHYEYPEANIGFDSYMIEEKDLKEGQIRLLSVDNPLVVPVDTNIRVLTTGGDVIHAFAMPAMGVKKDAMPGRLNETWFRANKTGTFYGQCSELCGVKHGFMPIELRVVTKEEYQKWLEEAKTKFSASLPAYQQFASIQ